MIADASTDPDVDLPVVALLVVAIALADVYLITAPRKAPPRYRTTIDVIVVWLSRPLAVIVLILTLPVWLPFAILALIELPFVLALMWILGKAAKWLDSRH